MILVSYQSEFLIIIHYLLLFMEEADGNICFGESSSGCRSRKSQGSLRHKEKKVKYLIFRT